jgi:hypothetical protein
MIFRRCAPEPDRLGPTGRPSVSLGAGEPASESGWALRARLEVCRFFAGGAEVSSESSQGAERLFGKAREPRLDSGGADPGSGVARLVRPAAGARDGARELARALTPLPSFVLGTGVIDRGAGLLFREARLPVAGLVPDWLVSNVLLMRFLNFLQNVIVNRLVRVNIPFHTTTRRQVKKHPLR